MKIGLGFRVERASDSGLRVLGLEFRVTPMGAQVLS